jgi:hypothetical protein
MEEAKRAERELARAHPLPEMTAGLERVPNASGAGQRRGGIPRDSTFPHVSDAGAAPQGPLNATRGLKLPNPSAASEGSRAHFGGGPLARNLQMRLASNIVAL